MPVPESRWGPGPRIAASRAKRHWLRDRFYGQLAQGQLLVWEANSLSSAVFSEISATSS